MDSLKPDKAPAPGAAGGASSGHAKSKGRLAGLALGENIKEKQVSCGCFMFRTFQEYLGLLMIRFKPGGRGRGACWSTWYRCLNKNMRKGTFFQAGQCAALFIV